MHKTYAIFAFAAALAGGTPAIAQNSTPGAPGPARVVAGHYKVDSYHTQVVWTVNHMGISPLSGVFGASGGTLEIDPAKPSAAKVSITFNVADMNTTSPALTTQLLSAAFFDVAKFPTATFTSTSLHASGSSAKIIGNLTIKGITRPVTLDASLFGVGTNPLNKKLSVGFSGTATIKRSEFGLGYGVPMIADQLDLRVVGAFERVD